VYKKFNDIKEHIKKVYLSYSRPLVIGYSGGKDSSAILQLVWMAIEEISPSERKNHVYIITTDTLVETPYVINYVNHIIESLNRVAKEKKLPITAYKLRPETKDSFWVNLLGKGYPAPSQMFRWCTERLKIRPVNVFIQKYVSQFGEATIVLGARKSESISRAQVLEKKKRDNLGLSLHLTLPGAFVYTPIENLRTDEVWEFLLEEVKTPWGTSNLVLFEMYENASGGECPIAIDSSTPSCGNSRFGCWVCTLVRKDNSMDSVIAQGETWLKPLSEFRNMLMKTQNPDEKHKYRSYKRRNGKIYSVRDGSKIAYGPYKFKYKKYFLRELLKTQKLIQENGPDKNFELIRKDELLTIHKLWKEEESDWEDSLLKIYKEETGKDLGVLEDDSISLSKNDLKELKFICKDEDVNDEMIVKLINLEKRLSGMNKRHGIMNKIDKIFSEDWRTEDKAKEDIEKQFKEKENLKSYENK